MKPSTFALRVGPDLLRRRLDMTLAVGDVVELIGPDRAVRLGLRQRLGETAGIFHVIVGILVGDGRHLDQFGAREPQHLLLLVGLCLGDHDDGLQAERVADQRQANAGIAGGALDHGAAGLKLSRGKRIADDEKRGAVLYRLSRVHELGLAEDRAAGLFGRAFELDQRRIADRLGDAVADTQKERPSGRDSNRQPTGGARLTASREPRPPGNAILTFSKKGEITAPRPLAPGPGSARIVRPAA